MHDVERTIRGAQLDQPSINTGPGVEARVRYIAAALCVPEFVYRPSLIHKGAATREVGDGLLICGAGGVVLQVKARSYREGKRESRQSAERWIRKHHSQAVSQGRGSKRTIASSPTGSLCAVPIRSLVLGDNERRLFEIVIGQDCGSWPIVVVLDHPKELHVELPYTEDAFCVSLRDWTELNRHIRSVHGLLRYIDAVLDLGPQ